MKDYIKIDPWNIIEEGFDPALHKVSESLFSIGNGRMGQRANFEESYSGKTLRGSYLAGVYYPDKTRVGWWKNGYPEYFAKVLNSVNWIGIDISVDGVAVDLAHIQPKGFQRKLNMQNGLLERHYTIELQNGNQLQFKWTRFCHITRKDLGVIRLEITATKDCELTINSYLDGAVYNQDSNYDEFFWEQTSAGAYKKAGVVWVRQQTRKTGFKVLAGAKTQVQQGSEMIPGTLSSGEMRAEEHYRLLLKSGQTLKLEKYVAVLTDMYHQPAQFEDIVKSTISAAVDTGFEQLLDEQIHGWADIWKQADILIEGDDAAQQGIRFNIFQLFQTYNGDDARLNIGPKGFTGEKYGGSTYWDTEAYCIPFYLGTASPEVSRNLLLYRYQQLPKAIENAEKLGFSGGAALYPMVTMNGEECHNEWEITFEEIHRNGAIAYAIYDYINYTGDADYMASHGLEVLIGIARFWAQRVNWSNDKNKFVMLGVTGPNEFENNVNNNWYTNYIASWCMRYAAEQCEWLKTANPSAMNAISGKTALSTEEVSNWKHIQANMYFPYDPDQNVFLQQDGFLDKELIPVSDLPASQRPIVEHWSWDRILRSCYIKQADVLQGFYFFEDDFDADAHRRHFDFYEQFTVHESSLSPCIHSILANKIGNHEKAYEFYLRTSRLDLNDINNDTCDGCHITSMAGTWMTISKGFAGIRVKNGKLHFNPALPNQWKSLTFNLRFRENLFYIHIAGDGVQVTNTSGPDTSAVINGIEKHLPQSNPVSAS
jgi:maltose phosphorylase